MVDRDGNGVKSIEECCDGGMAFITYVTLSAAAFVSDPDGGPLRSARACSSGADDGDCQSSSLHTEQAIVGDSTFNMIIKVNQHHPIAVFLTSLAEGCKPCFLPKDSTSMNAPENCDFLTEAMCTSSLSLSLFLSLSLSLSYTHKHVGCYNINPDAL